MRNKKLSPKEHYQKEIDKVVRIIKKLKPEKIILFGSFAYGEIHRDSDVDLCVIKKGDRLKIKRQIWRLLWQADYDWQPEVDIHIYPPHLYKDYLLRNDPFLEEVEKGKILYERSR